MKNTDEKKNLINQLLKKIQGNDLFALGELLELKTPDIQRISFNILRDRALVEDITNEVIISLIKNVHTFKNYENINGWLNTVTINKSIDMFRKRKKENLVDESILSSIAVSTDFENSLTKRLAIAQTLEEMDSLESKILIDKFVGNQTYDEIAKTYGLTVKQVRLRLVKAKENFSKIYSK